MINMKNTTIIKIYNSLDLQGSNHQNIINQKHTK